MKRITLLISALASLVSIGLTSCERENNQNPNENVPGTPYVQYYYDCMGKDPAYIVAKYQSDGWQITLHEEEEYSWYECTDNAKSDAPVIQIYVIDNKVVSIAYIHGIGERPSRESVNDLIFDVQKANELLSSPQFMGFIIRRDDKTTRQEYANMEEFVQALKAMDMSVLAESGAVLTGAEITMYGDTNEEFDYWVVKYNSVNLPNW